MRTAILRQLRLLIACLVLAVAARPAVTALEVPRAVATLVAHAGAVSTPRAAARAESRARAPRALPARRQALDAALPRLAAVERTPHRGTAPLYLTNERFLL